MRSAAQHCVRTVTDLIEAGLNEADCVGGEAPRTFAASLPLHRVGPVCQGCAVRRTSDAITGIGLLIPGLCGRQLELSHEMPQTIHGPDKFDPYG